jgi:hypothetical protein
MKNSWQAAAGSGQPFDGLRASGQRTGRSNREDWLTRRQVDSAKPEVRDSRQAAAGSWQPFDGLRASGQRTGNTEAGYRGRRIA